MLELACGTGWWTERLARFADSLTCVDASSEVIGINAQRLRDAGLAMPSYVEADLFAWLPTETFDVVFFSFWLSHVPPDRFEAFWALVDRLLAPGGRVFFIDSQRDGTSVSFDPLDMANYDGVQARELKDGRRGSA